MIVLSLLGTTATVLSITQLLQVRQTSQRYSSIRFHVESLRAALEASEAAERNYLITNDTVYRDYYRRNTNQLPGILKVVERQSAGTGIQANVSKLRPLMQERINRLDAGVRRHDSGETSAVLADLYSGRGRQIMDELRGSIQEIGQYASGRLDEGRGRIQFLAYAALMVSIGTLLFISLLSALVYYLFMEAIQTGRKLDRAKDEFVSLASHQLRTPATGIKSILHSLKSGDLGPLNQQQQYFIGKAIESNEREIRIVDELLTVARAEAGRMVYRPSEFDLTSLISSVISEQRPTIDKMDIILQFNDPGYPVEVRADKEKIFMAIANLLDNALKYTPEHGGVTIWLHEKRKNVVVEVADTGIGIDDSEMKHIFDRFERASSVLKGTIEGTGLGLYLVRCVAELHNGSITVSSKKGYGSKFTMTIPRRRA